MKRPHLLRVDGPPGAFAPLLDALAALGLRGGWLELGAVDPAPLPASLEAAAAVGMLRAVAVGPRGSVAVKPRAGRPVLDDLLREHFLGCRLVLVEGAGTAAGDAGEVSDAPRLVATDEGRFRIELPAGGAEELAAETLAARLRKPRPWGG